MKQDKKFWSKNDEMLIADTKVEPGPMDPFKTVYQKSEKNGDVALKVTSMTVTTHASDGVESDGPGFK